MASQTAQADKPAPANPKPQVDVSAGTIDTLNQRAWELRSSDTKQSGALAKKAHLLATSIYYSQGQAVSLLALAWAAFHEGEMSQAAQRAKQARKLFEAFNNTLWLARTRNLQGILSGEQGDLETSLEHFLEAHKGAELALDLQDAANALGNAASIYTYLSDYVSALETHLKVLGLHEEMDYADGVARTLIGLGICYHEMGQYEDASLCFLRSLEMEATKANPRSHALAMMNAGRTSLAKNDLEAAFNYSQDALETLAVLEDRSGMSYALDTLGALYLLRNLPNKALEQFQQAIAIKETLGDRLGIAITRLEVGRFYHSTGQLKQAEQVLQLAIADAEASGSKAEVYKAHLALATTYEAQENHQAALASYKYYMQIKEEVFNQTSDRKLQGLRVTFAVQQAEREREIYRLKNVELAKANAKKEKLLKQLKRQAEEDSLTGLYNRRYFDNALAKAYVKAQLQNEFLTVVICDVDNFKLINDHFSHAVGDSVLTTVAEIFQNNIRTGDIVARYGGEEFVLLLPNTRLEDALKLCERLRDTTESYRWHSLASELRVTFSCGVSDDLSLISGEKMVAQADDFLYQAKRTGKNRVCSRLS